MPGTGILTMWQSGINMFTFGHNLALGAFGKAVATPARKPWRQWLDRFITVVLAVAFDAVRRADRADRRPASGRGGAYRVRLKVL